MFQQNGRRTRGSSAPSTGRVVYLEYTIPPQATLSSLNAAQAGRAEGKERRQERERAEKRERERQDLCMEGGSRGTG